jgi:hypothetical protein
MDGKRIGGLVERIGAGQWTIAQVVDSRTECPRR